VIRIVIQTQNCNAAAHVAGAAAVQEFATFDVYAPEVEQFMAKSSNTYETEQFVGVELLPNGGPHTEPQALADRLERCVRLGFVSRRVGDKDAFDVDDLLEVSEVAHIVSALRFSTTFARREEARPRPDRAKMAIAIARILNGDPERVRVALRWPDEANEMFWSGRSDEERALAYAIYDLMVDPSRWPA
jgi:hypothetical protein